MAVQVHPLDRILNLTILQPGLLSISLGRLRKANCLCRLVLTFVSLDLRLIHACTHRKWRHLYRWLPRLSRVAHTLCLRVRIRDRILRHFQAIWVNVVLNLCTPMLQRTRMSPLIIADVAPSSITVAARHQLPAIVSRPSTAGKRQPKSSVPIGINKPSFGSVREESQSGVTGSKSIGIESQPYSVADVAEPRPTSIDVGHPLSEGVARPSPVHARPTPTQTPTSMSAGLISAAHAVCPSSVDAHVSRPTLADDEPAMRQPTSAYTGQYTAVCTGLQVQTSAETDCSVIIVVGPLPYVAAVVVTLKRA